jgi:hypothetical protein
MKNNICFITFAAICLLMLTQCHKKECNMESLGNITFTETDLSIIPYTGLEELIFRDSLGDSVIYNSGIRFSNYDNYVYENFDPQNIADCWGDYYKTEQNFTYFYKPANGIGVEVSIAVGNPFKDTNNYIYIGITYTKTQSWSFGCAFVFDSLKLSNTATPLYGNGSIAGYYDSIAIGPDMYYSVYSLVQNTDPLHSENLKTVYYSISKGIVGFKTEEGHLWFLSHSIY